MDENIFSLTPEQLFESLHGALVEGDLQQAGALAKVVDQHWAFAVVDRDRAKIHLLGHKLLEAATTAAGVEENPRLAAWNQRWLVLSEMAELILAIDTESAAVEDRKALQSFTHADKVLRFLNEERIGTLAEIQKAIGGAGTRQTTWNHVSRLVKSGMLTRVDEGVYRLTSRGQAVARLLAEEKSDEESSCAPIEIDPEELLNWFHEHVKKSAETIYIRDQRPNTKGKYGITIQIEKSPKTYDPAADDRTFPRRFTASERATAKGQS